MARSQNNYHWGVQIWQCPRSHLFLWRPQTQLLIGVFAFEPSQACNNTRKSLLFCGMGPKTNENVIQLCIVPCMLSAIPSIKLQRLCQMVSKKKILHGTVLVQDCLFVIKFLASHPKNIQLLLWSLVLPDMYTTMQDKCRWNFANCFWHNLCMIVWTENHPHQNQSLRDLLGCPFFWTRPKKKRQKTAWTYLLCWWQQKILLQTESTEKLSILRNACSRQEYPSTNAQQRFSCRSFNATVLEPSCLDIT